MMVNGMPANDTQVRGMKAHDKMEHDKMEHDNWQHRKLSFQPS